MERTNCEMQIEELMKKSNEICVMANEPLAEEILKTLEETVERMADDSSITYRKKKALRQAGRDAERSSERSSRLQSGKAIKR